VLESFEAQERAAARVQTEADHAAELAGLSAELKNLPRRAGQGRESRHSRPVRRPDGREGPLRHRCQGRRGADRPGLRARAR